MNNQQHKFATMGLPPVFEESNHDSHHCLVMTHVYWTTKLRFAVTDNEILDVATISKDDCCGLGEWLHIKHAHLKTAHHPNYHACVAKHAEFHLEAGKIATLINSKRYDDARQLFDCTSRFDYAYSNAVAAFITLKQELSLPPENPPRVIIKPVRRIGLDMPQLLSFRFPISL